MTEHIINQAPTADSVRTEIKSYLQEIEGINAEWLVELHNTYCYARRNTDQLIFWIEEFDSKMSGVMPSWIATKICEGSFNANDCCWWYDSKRNLASTSLSECLPISIDSIASYCVDNNDCLCDDNIRFMLDELFAGND